MLQILMSRDWMVATGEVLRRVTEDVRMEKGGRILMVPELISHETERALCAAAGDSASRFAQVLSFTRLARRVADTVGSAAEQSLDNGGRVVAMAAAAQQIHSRLKSYASVQTKPEFLTGLVEAVDEFKRCCITSHDLMEASKRAQGSLAQKLEELALLLESYDALCSRGKRDPRDQMSWLLEQLADSDFAEKHVFYFDAFPDFTRQHMAILEHLIRCSPSVTVSLNCDRVGSPLMAFETAGKTANALLRCAREAGVEATVTTLESEQTPLRAVRDKLFQGKIEAGEVDAQRLGVYRAGSVYEECMAAAQQVMQFVRKGCRYRDISIVCSDAALYKSELELAFQKCRIPLYLSGTESITEKTVVGAVLTALDAALGAMDREDVVRYLKSVISPLSADDCDMLENYVLLWNIRASQWQRSFDKHPQGLGKEWMPRAQQTLTHLNELREAAITPLLHLRTRIQGATVLGEQVEALYAFFEEIHLSALLDRLAAQSDAAGDNRSAQIFNQIWEILLDALEQMHDVLGRTSWNADTFARLLSLLLSQYDVGTIPPVLDAVMAGEPSAMRCQREKHLIVLGAEEGMMPRYGGSSGVLSDQERSEARSLGLALSGGAIEGMQSEFAQLYGVFSGAAESVSVYCSAQQPSYLYRRLSTLSSAGEQQLGALLGEALASRADAGRLLARWGAQEEAAQLGALDEYRDAFARARHTLGSVAQQQIRSLYGAKLNLSASQADTQAKCRLEYFLKYGLHAQERKPAEIDPAEFGTYVHAVLEGTARRVVELGGFPAVSMETTLDIADEFALSYAREHFSQLDSERTQYLLERNHSELRMVVCELWQELSQSAFAPVGFEVGFKDGEQMAPIPIASNTMAAQLIGFVDRVDVWRSSGKTYFRVVDYKTGKKTIDYCDIFNGVGLQMLLYLFALERAGDALLGTNPIPAGVQYFPARAPLLPSEGRLSEEEASSKRLTAWNRSGLLLGDRQVLEAMQPEGMPNRLCCSFKKDGTLTGDCASAEQFRLLRAYIEQVLANMVDEIASGNIDPNPYTRGQAQNPCEYCPYGAICHKQDVSGRRNFKKMSAQRFWDEVEKVVKRHG